MSAPSVSGHQLVFSLNDPERRLIGVALDCDDAIAGRRRFRRTAAGWTLRVPRPHLVRLEYRLLLSHRGGSDEVVCDPENPERVRTAFGERSVAFLPSYQAPSWLSLPAADGSVTDVTHQDDRIGALPIRLWSPDGLAPESEAPLLMVHDGPEYADLAALTRYCSAMVTSGQLRPFRAALMHPVTRDEWYAANPDYIAAEIASLDTIGAAAAVSGPVVVMGASLGGLCALLVALREGGPRFGGVFSQSGSFFRPKLDEQESSYPFFARVVESVQDVTRKRHAEQLLTIAMTCGRTEENFANNTAMAEALQSQGHEVRLEGVDDLHNYTAWRDSLHPSLTDVLRSVWGAPG